jgi:hypothetical protein
MFLVYLIGNQTLTRKLALPPSVGEFAEGLEEQINAMQRHVRWTVQRIAFLIAQNHAHLTAGDLIVADGLISVLIANPTAQWRDFEAMLRVSPLTRLLRAERLAELAGDPALVARLRPRRFVTDWEDSGILQLAQAGYIPGMHFRLAQCLADACHPNFHPLLFEEMASVVEWLNDTIVYNLREREKDLGTDLCFPTEGEFWVGALVTRAVSLVERDGFLQSLKARSATGGFLKPFNTDGLVDLLYRSLRDHPHLQEHRLKGTCYQYIKDQKERLDSQIGW